MWPSRKLSGNVIETGYPGVKRIAGNDAKGDLLTPKSFKIPSRGLIGYGITFDRHVKVKRSMNA